MTNYVKSTDFAVKDSLISGNPSKLVKGAEINTEFAAIQSADATSIKGGGSSVDNAIARFDGTGGYLLQSSGATIDDSGNLTANGLALTVTLPVTSGGTGASTAADARTALGVTPANIGAAASGSNSDITSLASPAIAGATATTQAVTDSTTKVATTAFVRKFKQLAQIVTASTGAYSSGTTVIPNDNTIPQNTEGTQVLTATFTPTNAASTLEVSVTLQASNAGAAWIVGALFRDAGANAVAVGTMYTSTGNAVYPITFTYLVSAGSTAATTFNVRLGASAGTYYLNGNSSGQLYGGAYASSITIKEHLP